MFIVCDLDLNSGATYSLEKRQADAAFALRVAQRLSELRRMRKRYMVGKRRHGTDVLLVRRTVGSGDKHAELSLKGGQRII